MSLKRQDCKEPSLPLHWYYLTCVRKENLYHILSFVKSSQDLLCRVM